MGGARRRNYFAACGVGTGLAISGAGVGICMIGTRIIGNLGFVVFTVNSTGWPSFALKSGANVRFTLNILPACTSSVCTLTPSAFTSASESFIGVLLLLRMVINCLNSVFNGVVGRRTLGGMATRAGCGIA